MSGVNISILEGGKAENFGQVTKLKTSNGSGSDLWVPKTDVETKHLSVKKNGLYYTNQYEPTASEKKDGKFYDIYGWDTITVNVKKKAKGKKKKTSPKTGLEYDAPTSVDVDDDGNLIETELPVYIEIEQPPDKLEYRDGENISKTGMIVKAYYGDDREWGVVPNDELTLDPSTASGGGGGEIPVFPAGTFYKVGFTDGTYLTLPRTNMEKTFQPQVDYSVVLPSVIAGVSASAFPSYDISKTDKNGNAWRFFKQNYTAYISINGDVKWSTNRGAMMLYYDPDTKLLHWQETRVFIPETSKPNYTLIDGIGVDGITVADAIAEGMAFQYNFYKVNNYRSGSVVADLEMHFKKGTASNVGDFQDGIVSNGSSYDTRGVNIGDVVDADENIQTVTVGWTPPEGEEELTDTFDITVIPSN